MENDRQVDTGEYDSEKLERLRRDGEALQRQMRCRVAEHNLQSTHARAPATELYWAVMAALVDNGTVNANVMRRDAPDKRTVKLIQQGKQSECDLLWLAKLKGQVRCGSATRLCPHVGGDHGGQRHPAVEVMAVFCLRGQWSWRSRAEADGDLAV